MKKISFITTLLVITVLLCSCNSAPTVNVEYISPQLTPSISPSPYVILTDNQKGKIRALLDGALNMFNDSKDGASFQDTSALSADDLLSFAYTIINDEYGLIGEDYTDTETISSAVIQNIIHSAFGIDYTPKKGDSYDEMLMYDGESFHYEGSDPELLEAHPYSITRQLSSNLLIKFNVVEETVPDIVYRGKKEALLQEDSGSLFGYRLVSLTKVDKADIAFTSTEASSCLPADGLRTYVAENAIDGDDSTSWASKGEKGEWIKLSFDKPQDITGLIYDFGDCSSYDAFQEHALPFSFNFDFSDGTSQVFNEYEVHDVGGDPCLTFDKVINTSYIKITITDILEGSEGSGGGVYISEIKPF